ncbi:MULTISPECIES: hypothetical protein [unclassified Cytobacillus]|uniref:hypothetical protein n=1 Tax=unclassified Cytobacillus TaxID=2675268 RepID=UPI00203F5FDD|nr:hypothetical protein [Cytobacillus sp. AMY 15.2]MCM3090657.1 hypothetical protein [Cytobacillus sp. AMY 15.2]
MEEIKESASVHSLFFDVITKAYERGTADKELSVKQLLMDIEDDLRKIITD